MKKLFALLLAFTMLLGVVMLTACGSSDESSASATAETTGKEAAQTTSEAADGNNTKDNEQPGESDETTAAQSPAGSETNTPAHVTGGSTETPVETVPTAAPTETPVETVPVEGDPAQRLQKAVDAERSVLTDSVMTLYRKSSENGGILSGNFAFDGQIDVSVGTPAQNLIAALLASRNLDVSMDWLKNLSFRFGTVEERDLNASNFSLSLNGTNLFDASIFADFTNERLAAKVPFIDEDWLAIPAENLFEMLRNALSESFGNEPGEPRVGVDLDQLKEIAEMIKSAIPDDATIELLVNRYIGIVFENLKKVDAGEEVLTVGEISGTRRTIVVTIDNETVVAVLKAVLTNARNDAEIKGVIENTVEKLKEIAPDRFGEGDVYKGFTDGIDKLLAEINEKNSQLFGSDFSIPLTFYLDKADKICGVKLTIPGSDLTVSIYSVENGTEYACKIAAFYPAQGMAQTIPVELCFAGTKVGEVITGNLYVNYDGKRVIGIDLENVDLASLKEGCFVGKVTIAFNEIKSCVKKLTGSDLPSEVLLLAGILGNDLKLTFEGTKVNEGRKFGVRLTSDLGNVLVIDCSVRQVDGNVTPPVTEKSIEDIADKLGNEEMLNKVISLLKEAGVPDSLIGLMTQAGTK